MTIDIIELYPVYALRQEYGHPVSLPPGLVERYDSVVKAFWDMQAELEPIFEKASAS